MSEFKTINMGDCSEYERQFRVRGKEHGSIIADNISGVSSLEYYVGKFYIIFIYSFEFWFKRSACDQRCNLGRPLFFFLSRHNSQKGLS